MRSTLRLAGYCSQLAAEKVSVTVFHYIFIRLHLCYQLLRLRTSNANELIALFEHTIACQSAYFKSYAPEEGHAEACDGKRSLNQLSRAFHNESQNTLDSKTRNFQSIII
jgi:signal transduction histidine kinase